MKIPGKKGKYKYNFFFVSISCFCDHFQNIIFTGKMKSFGYKQCYFFLIIKSRKNYVIRDSSLTSR